MQQLLPPAAAEHCLKHLPPSCCNQIGMQAPVVTRLECRHPGHTGLEWALCGSQCPLAPRVPLVHTACVRGHGELVARGSLLQSKGQSAAFHSEPQFPSVENRVRASSLQGLFFHCCSVILVPAAPLESLIPKGFCF